MKKILSSLVVLGIILNFSLLPFTKVNAQESNAGFSISPPSFDLNANPGDKIQNTIKIENSSTENIQLKVRAENFVAYGEGGQVNLTEEDSSYSINKWITFDKTEFSVESGTTSLFNFTINVPQNTEPGSHYGAVVFATSNPNNDPNTSSVVQEIGSIILIRIPGDVVEEASLVSFKADKDYFTEPKVKLDTLIENTGSVHFKPFGFVTIKDIFGNKLQTIEIEPKNILPDSKRVFDTEFDFESVGYFKAELQMFYSNGGKSITSETTFISLYTQRLIPIAVILLVVIVLYLILRKRINKAIRIIIKG